MGPKKDKGKGKPPPPPPKGMVGPPPKPKKPPPPPACFNSEDLARFKEMFKAHDEENIDKVHTYTWCLLRLANSSSSP